MAAWGWGVEECGGGVPGKGNRVSLGDNENALKLLVAVDTQFWDEKTMEWCALKGKIVRYVNCTAIKLFFKNWTQRLEKPHFLPPVG